MNVGSRSLFRNGPATEVQELLGTNLVTIRSNQTVRDALMLMVDENVSALPVIDSQGQLVGIVSTSDLMKIVMETVDVLQSEYPHYDDCLWAVELVQKRLGTDKVIDVMSEILTVVHPETVMHDAACIMLNNRVHHLPVVNSGGQIVGMLSSTEFARLTAGTKR